MSLGDAAFSRGDIMRRLAFLEDEVRRLRSARRLESASIGEGGLRIKGEGGLTIDNGGGIRVEDGGRLAVYQENGAELFAVYRSPEGSYLLTMRRENYVPALQIQKHSNGRQYIALSDNSARILVSDDAESGIGLARPWLPVSLAMKFVPEAAAGTAYGYATIDASELASETQLWEGRASISHPKISVDGVWGRGSGTVNTTYRMRVNGVLVGSWFETGLTVATRGPFDVSNLVGSDWATVEVVCEATSGTGAVACQVLGCYLQQS